MVLPFTKRFGISKACAFYNQAVCLFFAGIGSIFLIVGLVIFYKFGNVFKDHDVYYLEIKQDVVVPKIIHQTWKNENLTGFHKSNFDSWTRLYPDYEHILWTDDKVIKFVKEEFPWYYDVWIELYPNIKKFDTVRYMWMFKYGGFYVDLDLEAKQRFGDLFKYDAAYIPTTNFYIDWNHNSDRASPAFLASTPNNLFWMIMLKYVAVNSNQPVKIATGPVAVSNVLSIVKKCSQKGHVFPFNLVFLSETLFGIGALKFLYKYSYHHNSNGWEDADTPNKEISVERNDIHEHINDFLEAHDINCEMLLSEKFLRA